MSIIRVIAVDPRPRVNSGTDLVVYQVPERSREYELLLELFEREGIVSVELESRKLRRKRDVSSSS